MKNNTLINGTINNNTKVFSLRYEGGAWADLIVVEKNNGEYWNVILHTDWGMWSYTWSKSGMRGGIYDFLAGASNEYLIDKFTKGKNMIYDGKATAQTCRSIIEKEFDLKEIDNLNFKEELEEVEGFKHVNEFFYGLGSNLNEFLGSNSHECIQMEWHPREKYFFENIFPDFIPLLKEHKKDFFEFDLF